MNFIKATFLFIYCFITKLPGPPTFQIEELNFQLYPIDRSKCPGIDPQRDVIFELYKSGSPSRAEIMKIGDPLLTYDFFQPTVIFVHGFLESSNSKDATEIKDAYLKKGAYNIIIVNTGRLTAGPFYNSAIRNVIPIAQHIAKFINYMVSQGLYLSRLHLIGMSLGAHIVGMTSSFIEKGKPSRITGLDPAGPIFGLLPGNLRLDKNDAEFVDVIHSDAGIFGYPRRMGHVDFWVNGGSGIQPGCYPYEIKQRSPGSVAEFLFCNHWIAYQLYVKSIKNPTMFTANKCDSWRNYMKNKCKNNEEIYVGYLTPTLAVGDYYLHTKYPNTL